MDVAMRRVWMIKGCRECPFLVLDALPFLALDALNDQNRVCLHPGEWAQTNVPAGLEYPTWCPLLIAPTQVTLEKP